MNVRKTLMLFSILFFLFTTKHPSQIVVKNYFNQTKKQIVVQLGQPKDYNRKDNTYFYSDKEKILFLYFNKFDLVNRMKVMDMFSTKSDAYNYFNTLKEMMLKGGWTIIDQNKNEYYLKSPDSGKIKITFVQSQIGIKYLVISDGTVSMN